jgi:hypothetical protein
MIFPIKKENFCLFLIKIKTKLMVTGYDGTYKLLTKNR